MKKVAILVIALLALTAFMVVGASAQTNASTTVTMNALNGSGQDGTATITNKSAADVSVSLSLNNGTSTAQPAHIHKGSCANLDPNPAFPLTSATNGKSDTDVMVAMSELAKGGYAINVHKSATEAATYVSCGDIKAMMTTAGGTTGATTGNSSLPNTGAGYQPLFVALLGLLALTLTGVGLKLARSARR